LIGANSTVVGYMCCELIIQANTYICSTIAAEKYSLLKKLFNVFRNQQGIEFTCTQSVWPTMQPRSTRCEDGRHAGCGGGSSFALHGGVVDKLQNFKPHMPSHTANQPRRLFGGTYSNRQPYHHMGCEVLLAASPRHHLPSSHHSLSPRYLAEPRPVMMLRRTNILRMG
jgi:hypothetical protein